MYEKLLVKALETSADIVGCDFFDDYIAHSTIRKQLFPQQSEKCVKKMLRGELHCGTWNKLITKSLYERTKIGFPKVSICGRMYLLLFLYAFMLLK